MSTLDRIKKMNDYVTPFAECIRIPRAEVSNR
jgi:hypothetical protein